MQIEDLLISKNLESMFWIHKTQIKILTRDLKETTYRMKSSTKKIVVMGIIVLSIVSIVAGVLGGRL